MALEKDADHYYVVMELCSGKDLFDFVLDKIDNSPHGCLTERDAATITRQCLKAVMGCHSKGFIHRDLKLENFMLVGVSNACRMATPDVSCSVNTGFYMQVASGMDLGWHLCRMKLPREV